MGNSVARLLWAMTQDTLARELLPRESLYGAIHFEKLLASVRTRSGRMYFRLKYSL